MSVKAATSRVVLNQTSKTLTKFIKKTLRFIVPNYTILFIIEYNFIRYSFYVIDIDALFYKVGQN